MTQAIRGEIVAEIEASGPISFERFMELALYGEQGFYIRVDGGSAGRRGDFITSPEVGPLFGAVIGRYLDAEWERIGRPDPFVVVDVGARAGHPRPLRCRSKAGVRGCTPLRRRRGVDSAA